MIVKLKSHFCLYTPIYGSHAHQIFFLDLDIIETHNNDLSNHHRIFYILRVIKQIKKKSFRFTENKIQKRKKHDKNRQLLLSIAVN